jgi:hypothetical protein
VVLTSDDGIAWNAVTTPVPLSTAGCRSLRHPALVERVFNDDVLFFSCEDEDGQAFIGRATSTDLETWEFEVGAALAPAPGDASEVDGISAPTVIVDAHGNWQIWFEARAGVRRVLHFAASSNGLFWERWAGTVLAPGAAGTWDDLQVADPSVVATADGFELRLFYTGLGPAGQAIGVVSHALPVYE